MAYTREERSASPRSSRSPVRGRRLRRSRSRSPNGDKISNPGNNLYVTGLSTRVTNSDLEKLFGKEGKVVECNLVIDPRSRESRGFAFIAMDSVEDAERCIKNLNRSVLEGRLLTVEKAKRKRGRTPTPGRYQGLRGSRGGGGGGGHGRRRSRSRSRSRSPRHLPDTESHPRDRRGRSRSPPHEKKTEDHSASHRRHRERSSSIGRDGHRR